MLKEEFEEQHLDAEDWRTPIKAKFMSPEGVADLKTLKDYVLISSDLYRRLLGGVLARCVSLREATKKLTEVHERSCEFSDRVSLYHRLQHLGYFWPNMSKEAPVYRSNVHFVSTNMSLIKSMQHLFLVTGALLFLNISSKTFYCRPARQQFGSRNWL